MKFFEKIKLFAIDLDGTLYFGKNVAPGANELIEYLREKYKIAFFTNNSSQNDNEVLEKLNGMGIKCSNDEIHTSSTATVSYLKESGIDNIYVIGSDSFRTELESNGLRIVDNSSADNLVVGLDTEFNYNNSPENVRRSSSEKNKLPDAIISMEIATITINKFKE